MYQKAIFRFLADHTKIALNLYHTALNVFQVYDFPPGPARESVAFHECSHGMLFQNIYGKIIFCLLYSAYDGLSWCALFGRYKEFVQAWQVFGKYRHLAGLLLKNWQLTQEGFACLRGLKTLRSWNLNNQTYSEIEEKKRFEKSFWHQLRQPHNQVYRQAVDLYQSFLVGGDDVLPDIANALSSLSPLNFCKCRLSGDRNAAILFPDDMLEALSRLVYNGTVKIPHNIADTMQILKDHTGAAFNSPVENNYAFGDYFLHNFLPFLYLEPGWPEPFKEKGMHFLEHLYQVAENKARQDKVHLTKVSYLPFEVAVDECNSETEPLSPVIRCNNPQIDMSVNSPIHKIMADLNRFFSIIGCIENQNDSPMQLYQALKKLELCLPDKGIDLFYVNVPVAAIKNDQANSESKNHD